MYVAVCLLFNFNPIFLSYFSQVFALILLLNVCYIAVRPLANTLFLPESLHGDEAKACTIAS